jgi:hypothetical protein
MEVMHMPPGIKRNTRQQTEYVAENFVRGFAFKVIHMAAFMQQNKCLREEN